NSIDISVPEGQYASIGDPSSLFFSNSFSAEFGEGASSFGGNANRLSVGSEYDVNAAPYDTRGRMSYSYYDYRVRRADIDTITIAPGTRNLTDLITGVYRVEGDIEIGDYTHLSGARVVLLVNGNARITTDIDIPTGEGYLFVVASGDIVFDSSIG